MSNIIIYHNNFHLDRDMHYLLNNLVLYLVKNYNSQVVYAKEDSVIDLFDNKVVIADCEILLYDKTQDSFKCLSFSDYQSQLIGFLINRNSAKDLIVCSQYISCGFWLSDDFLVKWKPNIYVPSTFGIDYDQYYHRRSLLKEHIDKFYFKGNVDNIERNSVKILKDNPLFHTGIPIEHLKYLDEVIKYKVGLSLPGIGEICYRDIEYMAIGVPIMKFEYVTKMNPELKPNYHYISLDREDVIKNDKSSFFYSVQKERLGGEDYAKKYLNTFNSIKDDWNFLNFIAKNAKEYYDTYLSYKNRIDHIIKILEL